MATGELTDAEVFGADHPLVYGPGSQVSGQPATPEQQAYARAALAARDPAAPAGTQENPSYDTPDATGAPGTYHVTPHGGLADPHPQVNMGELSDADVFGHQAAGNGIEEVDARPTSQSLGAKEGINTVFKNAINIATGDLPAMIGLPRQSTDLLKINPIAIPLRWMAHNMDAKTREAEKMYRPGLPGKIAGEAIASAPLAIDALGAIPLGMLQGALTSEHSSPLGKIADVGIGGVAGKFGDALGGVVKSVAAPVIRPAAQWAMDNGIRLTPGAISGGLMKGIEGGAAKGTLAGPMVSRAQRQMIDDANLSALNNALKPAGLALPGDVAPGTAAVDKAHTLFGSAYDKIAPKLTVLKDPTLDQQIAQLTQTGAGLEPQLANRFNGFVDKVTSGFDANGQMPGPEMRKLDSVLGKQARRFGRSEDPYHQEYADHIDELQDALREATERTNPAHAGELSALNSGYAQLVRLDKASVLAKQNGGVWTPDQLMSAVTAPGLDTSGRQTSSARGRALLQDWAQSAKDVLPNKMPNAGDFWSHLPELAVTYGVGHEAGLPAVGKMLLGEGALGAAYTPGAQSVIRAGMTQRPAVAKNVATLIEELRPLLSFGAASATPTLTAGLPAAQR